MNSLKAASPSLIVILLILTSSAAEAATIETVHVGNPGNVADSTGYGSVPYAYRIGKFEVTNAQYAEFLNGVDPDGSDPLDLYKLDPRGFGVAGITFDGGAANGSKYSIVSGLGNYPRAVVSKGDAYRFANWMHNGQGNGDTETGAYTMTANPITRNVGARWFLPTEDEWYKSAYHKNDGATGNYWEYPTSSDTQPSSDQRPGTDAPLQSNTANFFKNDSVANGFDDGYAVTGSPTFVNAQNYYTEVGAYAAAISPYGTFDQGGNVRE